MRDVLLLGTICAFMIGCASGPMAGVDRARSATSNFVPPLPELSTNAVLQKRDSAPSHTFLRTASYVIEGSSVEGGTPEIAVYDERSLLDLERQLKARALEDVSMQESVASDGRPFEITSSHSLVGEETTTQLEPHGTVAVTMLDDGEIDARVSLKNSALLRPLGNDSEKRGIKGLLPWQKAAEVQIAHQALDEAVVLREGQRLLIGPFMESVSSDLGARAPVGGRPTATGRQRYLVTQVVFLPLRS